MSAKRALIVDDSRSARVILGRMLEGFGIQSDAVESAEQAFEHLRHSRPDVVFMDHLMPGMDGFAAVKILKANPETATIPVLMYTSQEGELYMGQARALGAVGVLPKTVKPVDLTRLLHQLHLLPDRRQETAPIDAAIVNPPPRPAPQPESDWAAQRLQEAELRNYISNSFEALARRIATDFKAALSAPPLTETQTLAPTTESSRKSRRLWTAGAAAAVLLAVFVYLNQRVFSALRDMNASHVQLAAQLANQQQQVSELRGALRQFQNSAAPAAATSSEAVLLQTEIVPYGETPLAGARLERLRSIVERLRTQNTGGVLRLDHYVADYCLSGNATEGYSLAMEDLPARRCDVIGNPFEEGLSSAQQSSVAFANYMNTIPSITAGALRVEVNNAGRRPAVAYPPQSDALPAGEWNRIAVLNNRLEYSLVPAE